MPLHHQPHGVAVLGARGDGVHTAATVPRADAGLARTHVRDPVADHVAHRHRLVAIDLGQVQSRPTKANAAV
ncbi:hypothetical protein ACGFSI_34675 [Streptomyces virginiae]|uniref:hypothetical protein n=1 Tax=Streptomyces virginiae TaxID=1961 RepID=UPI0037136633